MPKQTKSLYDADGAAPAISAWELLVEAVRDQTRIVDLKPVNRAQAIP
jgi:hypothetical protein